MSKAERGIITQSHIKTMEALSEEIGAKLYPGEEDVLKDSDVLGI